MAEKFAPKMKEIVHEYTSGHFRYEIRGNWACALTARPPSFPLVWLAARAGIAPMTISLIALTVALSLPFLALFLPLNSAVLAVFLVGWVFQILDCVDGSLARVTGQTSLLGRHVDFLTDMAQWALLYVSIGILADRTFDTFWVWSLIAALAAWLRLYTRVFRDAYKTPGPPTLKPLTPRDIPFAFIAGLSALIPFLALAGPGLKAVVVFLVLYSLLDFIDTLMSFLRAKIE